MVTTVSSKGQITIPAPIRSRMRLNVGDKIDFIFFAPDRVELVPQRGSVEALKGIVRYGGPTVSLEEMDAAIACGGGGAL